MVGETLDVSVHRDTLVSVIDVRCICKGSFFFMFKSLLLDVNAGVFSLSETPVASRSGTIEASARSGAKITASRVVGGAVKSKIVDNKA